jgi:cell division protein FtsI (penicillin-binding protein 3)
MKKSRVLILFLVFAAFWGVVLLRSARLQILPDQRLAERKRKQFRTVVELPARRGSIVDRNGKELAVSVPTFSLFADPKLIESHRWLAKKLAPLLGQSASDIHKRIRDRSRRFVWLKRNLDRDLRDQIARKRWDGIGFVEESKRVYPNGELLSQVIGFIGREGRGLEGLERHYDSYLRGEKKVIEVEKDARGRPLVLDGQVFTELPAGADLELTIDSELQFVLERSLRDTVQDFSADGAVGIVMDVETNEVLAMGQSPTFDLNQALSTAPDLRRNKNITDVFEPGSVMKTLVVAGALNADVIKPNSKFDGEGGRMKVGDRIIREADASENYGVMTVSDIIAKSSNVGTAKIAFKLGEDRLRSVVTGFGFGERSGIETIGESKGLLQKTRWHDHLLANISFGHGIATTPLQIANAYAAIANGGELRTPLLVRSIRNSESGDEVSFRARLLRRVLNRDVASTMRWVLTGVTAPTGTGYLARIPGFPVAGKTGTAQKVDPKGGYKPGAYVSSFAGMVPSNNPKFVVYVAVDNPRDKYYGAQVAAPLFARVAGYAVRRAGLTPILISEDNLVGGRVSSSPAHSGADPSATAPIERIRKMAEMLRAQDENQVPDLRGLSLRDALNRVRGSDLKLQIRGTGQVTRTLPEPGETLPSSKTIQVILE